MSASSSYSRHRREPRRRRRNLASSVAATTATVAVAYGTYRLARWYWDEEEDGDEYHQRECDREAGEGREHPLEEDPPRPSSRAGEPPSRPPASAARTSGGDPWMPPAVTGALGWLARTAVGAVVAGVPGGSGHHGPGSGPSRPTRRQKLARCRYRAGAAFGGCFSSLRPAIEGRTDASVQTRELRALRKRKQELRGASTPAKPGPGESVADLTDSGASPPPASENERELRKLQRQEEDLWREILVQTTTRMVVSSYAYALLLLSLTVQFHWLEGEESASPGGMFPDSVPAQEEEQRRQREQEAFLMRSHQYLLNEGLPLLVSTVRRAVEDVCFGDGDDTDEETEDGDAGRGSGDSQHWTNPSSTFVTREEIEEALCVRLPRRLEDAGSGGRHRRGRRRRNWIRFVLPDEEAFDPIWDVCRSPVWEDAQEQVLGCLWHEVLRDGGTNRSDGRGWGGLFRPGEKANPAGPSGENTPPEPPGQGEKQPLVKVMARFKKAASSLFDDSGPETGWEGTIHGRLLLLPTVLELGDVTLE